MSAWVAALFDADGPQLPFADGNLPVVLEFLRAADALLVRGRCLVEPAQGAKTVASFRQAGLAILSAPRPGRSRSMASKRFRASSNRGKDCSDPPAASETRASWKKATAKS